MNPTKPGLSDSNANIELLSEREKQVLGLAAAGLLDKQIGPELGISLNTLRTYWTRIRSKLGEAPRAALAATYVANELRDEEKVHYGPVLHEGWVIDAQTWMMIAADSINDLHGLERGVPHPTTAYSQLYHPEDRDTARAEMHRVIRGEVEAAHLLFRLVPESGVQLVSLLMRGVRNRQGETYKIVGYRTRSLDCRPNHDPRVKLGCWYRNFATMEFRSDAEFREIFGLEGRDGDLAEAVMERLHPDDEGRIRTFVSTAIADGMDTAQGDSRVIGPDGATFWVRTKVRIERDENGVAEAFGTVAAFH